MTVVNSVGDVRKALDNGEAVLMAGNKKMEVALTYCAKHPLEITPEVGCDCALTGGEIVVITAIICMTIVALYALFKGKNIRLEIKGSDGGKTIFEAK